MLEAGTATGSKTVATAGVSGGGGAARLDTGWCVSSAVDAAAETASTIRDLIWGSDGAAFTLASAAARGERRPDDVAVERRECVVLDRRILEKLRKRWRDEEITPAEIKQFRLKRQLSEKESVWQSEANTHAINACVTRRRRSACMRTC